MYNQNMNNQSHAAWTDREMPDYFKGRDGGITQLGSFWRHTDQVASTYVELSQSRCLIDSKDRERLVQDGDRSFWLPRFGPLSYVAQGLVFIAHDHPDLLKMGNAVTDGNLVLLHRGLIEALNIQSYQMPKSADKKWIASKDHLLAFMAKCAEAVLCRELGVAVESQTSANAWDAGEIELAEDLACDKQLSFVSPKQMHAALSKAYGATAGSGYIDEICDRTDAPSEDRHRERTRSRIFKSMASWKEDTSLALEYTRRRLPGASDSGNFRAEEFVSQLEAHIQRHAYLSSAHEAALPHAPPAYQAMPLKKIENFVFSYGPSANYALHGWIDQFHREGRDVSALDEINACLDLADEAVFTHLFKGSVIFTPRNETNKKLSIGKYIASQPWFSQITKDWLLASSNVPFLGYASNQYETQAHVRDAAVVSILGQRDETITERAMKKEAFVQVVHAGGDMVMKGSTFQKYAGICQIGKNEAAFMHGGIERIKMYFERLDNEEDKSRALLLCAQNRHALTILPELMAQFECTATAKTEKNETVAHILLQNVHKKDADQLEAILVDLIDRGLDPHARDELGQLAGEQPESKSLVDHQCLIVAASKWEQQKLSSATAQPVAPHRRRQL